MANPRVEVTTEGTELLQAKYYCKVDRNKEVNVVLELKPNEGGKKYIPYRYVLVIDVSGSMGVTDQSLKCLLDRIKVFAKTFVQRMTKGSWLSIVQFSTDAEICLEMTEMDSQGRIRAGTIINGLEAGGCTNLSDGIFEALKTTISDAQTRDCIILFTDGQANEGIQNANQLVTEYKYLERKYNKNSRVPISAFTVGHYKPDLLREISKRLGCEAFYWLNEDHQIEADLFTPKILREEIILTDINIHLECLEGVTLPVRDASTHCLETNITDKTSVKELQYFFHCIPSRMKRNVVFELALPRNCQLDRKIILRVKKKFLDFQCSPQFSTDYLELRLKSMYQKRPKKDSGTREKEILQNTASYSMKESVIDETWDGSQEAFATVHQQNLRVITAKSLEQFGESGMIPTDVNKEMEKIKDVVTEVLGVTNHFCRKVCDEAEDFKEKLNFVRSELQGDDNWARMAAMESSLSAEMPPATGVCEPDKPKPFMPKEVATQHQSISEDVKLIEEGKALPELQTKAQPIPEKEKSETKLKKNSNSSQKLEQFTTKPKPKEINEQQLALFLAILAVCFSLLYLIISSYFG